MPLTIKHWRPQSSLLAVKESGAAVWPPSLALDSSSPNLPSPSICPSAWHMHQCPAISLTLRPTVYYGHRWIPGFSAYTVVISDLPWTRSSTGVSAQGLLNDCHMMAINQAPKNNFCSSSSKNWTCRAISGFIFFIVSILLLTLFS